jgi:pimeloyl-ACP methyl ester carboxylesterase
MKLKSRFDRVAGVRIHTLVGGEPADGHRPVVLAHGAAVSSRHMAQLGEALAPHVRVLVPDYPGHGRSDSPGRVSDVAGIADFLAAWLATLGLHRVHLLGNSFGCQVIAELAARRPELVDRLVLQGPTVDPGAHGIRQLWRWLVNTRREGSTQPRETFGQWGQAGPQVFWGTLRHMNEHRIEKTLPRVAAPTLVVRGSRDPIVPQPWADEAARLLPEGRLETIEGETHTIVLSAPEKLVDVTLPFLTEARRHDARGPGGR